MQFSEQWLRTWVNPNMTSEVLADLLTASGIEVEHIHPVAADFTDVVVAQVMEVVPHPHASRLNICQVAIGQDALLTIVCGAPNVRVGLKVPCALVGAQLPPISGQIPVLKIEIANLRGVLSYGMLCAARELGLSDDTKGLLELPQDALIGKDFRRYYELNDRQFTLKLTPNRGDCLSILGIAREVAALIRKPLPCYPSHRVSVHSDEILPVTIDAPDLCGRFSGRIMRGLNASVPTPLWMKQRLERSGVRSLSVLVDISNYVMLELGQPSHMFDLDHVHDFLQVRWGKVGESLTLLNGNTVQIKRDRWVGVIADAKGIQSLAGMIGGDTTKVSSTTKNVYIETAFWWPEAIAGRSRDFNFSTEAAHRFERGVDFENTVTALERISDLLWDICGTPESQVGPISDTVAQLPQRSPVTLRVARAEKVLGIALPISQVADILSCLNFSPRQTPTHPDIFVIIPPAYRFDITIEEDVIEEVARVIGFDTLPACAPVASQTFLSPPKNQRSLFALRSILENRDYQEVINFSFVDAAWEKDFSNQQHPIRLLNPIARQYSVMRSTLLGSLIANIKYNLNRQVLRIRLFEIAKVFLRHTPLGDSAPLPENLSRMAGFDQPMRIAACAYGSAWEEQWRALDRQVDFFDVKADVEALLFPLHQQGLVRFIAQPHPALHPGRSAQIMVAGHDVGIIGELHPRLQQVYELPCSPILFELDAAFLQKTPVPIVAPVSKFPAVIRDLAVVVPYHLPVQMLLDIFWEEKEKYAVCHWLQTVVLFDVYRGDGLADDEKSLAFRFTFQNTQCTLEEQYIEAAMICLTAAVTQLSQVRLRT